jgi:hypothetical protein
VALRFLFSFLLELGTSLWRTRSTFGNRSSTGISRP